MTNHYDKANMKTLFEAFEDDGRDKDEFFVVISEHGACWAGRLSKDGGKWHESVVEEFVGDVNSSNFGNSSYMSYLDRNELMSWMYRDFDNVLGPYDSLEDAKDDHRVQMMIEDAEFGEDEY